MALTVALAGDMMLGHGVAEQPRRSPTPKTLFAAEVRQALAEADLAGHSVHVFHGVADRIICDMGDFVDDYAVHPALRNDLGLLFLVTPDGPDLANLAPVRLEALPLFLHVCHSRLAHGEEWEWIRGEQDAGEPPLDAVRERDPLLYQ
ncbi:hypothetical protein ACH4E7_42800 [Kitasatospora sp. NPDC018058]|uniref:hypothetical protein n=1 Tax=Kitasatospora sp. NPDC018058 TaxID=3364025 RepID=UPI0037C000D6